MSIFLPTQTIRCINHGKIKDMIRAIESGIKFEPIDVVEHNNKFYIIDGHHRYLAHLELGGEIEYNIIHSDFEIVEYNSWNDIIEKIIKMRNKNE